MEWTSAPKRTRRIRAERERLLALYHASGQPFNEFIAAHHLKGSTFSNWLRQERRGQAAARRNGFTEIPTAGLFSSPAWAAEIILDQRHVVRLSGGADPHWVQGLLDALRQPC